METDLMASARALLARQTLAQYLATRPPRTVLSVTAADPLGLVLRRFACAGLVAAPLFADDARSRYCGFLDLLDVVAAVVGAARQPATPAGSAHGSALRHRAAAVAREMAALPVGSIAKKTNDAQLVFPSQLDCSLLEVVRDGFAYPTDDLACHRLAVFQPASSASGALMGGDAAALGELGMGDGDGDDNRSTSDLAGLATMAGLQVAAIVSQSDVVCFLHRHVAQLGPALLGSTLQQLGFREGPVVCVPADMAVVDALAAMLDARVPAVAVVDSYESGRLLGNLSISDLRGCLPEHFEQMAEPVGEFLQGSGWRDSPRWQPSGGAPASPRCCGVAEEFGIRSPESIPRAPDLAACTLQSRFGDVLDLLARRRLHRLFVVDAEGRPAGMLSINDVLRRVVAAAAPEK